MSKTTNDIIVRYHNIVKWLRQKPYTIKELQNKLLNKVTERQIRNNIQELKDSPHYMSIQNNKKGKYWIEEILPSQEKTLYSLSLLSFGTKMLENPQNINLVQFEKIEFTEYYNFENFIDFCKDCNIIKFYYYDFWWDEREYTVEPYLLKQFRNRWYLIAKIIEISGKKDGLVEKIDNQIYNFSLDRFSQEKGIINTQETFKNPNFDAKEFYENCFGVIKPYDYQNKNVEEVILSFEYIQGKYIKKLPLHHSQEIIFEDDKELRIRLKIYITYDFVQEIFYFRENVKVIAPQSLKDGIQKINAHIQTYYDQNDALSSRTDFY